MCYFLIIGFILLAVKKNPQSFRDKSLFMVGNYIIKYNKNLSSISKLLKEREEFLHKKKLIPEHFEHSYKQTRLNASYPSFMFCFHFSYRLINKRRSKDL